MGADSLFESLGLILFSTIFLSMLLVPATISLAYKVGAVDIPKSRSSHSTPKPRMGGLAISLSLLIACVLFVPFNNFWMAFVLGLVVVVATGVIDDIFNITPRWKFAGQIAAAVLFVYLSGMQITRIGDIVGLGSLELGQASFAFTVFCIVGGMNAFNLSDGLDGLTGGLTVITMAFFGYFAWISQQHFLLMIAISTMGAIVGFMRYNSYPSRVFMGDGGSLMLGYVVAVLLVSIHRAEAHVPLAALAMVIALPLLDTLVVMGNRIRNGHGPFTPDRTHLHHRLMEMGWSHPAVVVIIYCLMLIFGLLAVALQNQPRWVIFSSLMGLGGVIYAGLGLARGLGFKYKPVKNKKLESIRQTKIFKRVANGLKLTGKPIGIFLMLGLLFPALISPLMELSSHKVVMLYSAAAMLAYFSWRSAHGKNSGILHGTLYLVIFAVLLLYNLSAVSRPSWLAEYLNVLAALVLLWVVLKMVFSNFAEIVIASEFELLMLFLSWFVPFVVLKDLPLSSRELEAAQHTCLLSIPFLLAMKINIINFKENHRWITLPLIVAFAVIGMRG